MMKTCDFLIIGGGVIGLCLSLHLKKYHPKAKVIILEKEADCGLHASGRNSGVLHAGFYYTEDSLKAKFARSGNERLTQYCEEKKLSINKCGKLVVTRNESELKTLDILLERGKANGVILYDITEKEATELEPRVLTHQRALYSPHTSSVNTKEVMLALVGDAKNAGIEIHTQTKYIKKAVNSIKTSAGNYTAGFVINAAGLYADHIAKDFHFSKDYRILPFKGFYLYASEPQFSLKKHIYPVPDLKYPFLGVHFTLTIDGRIKIGPTAVPAFWREQYRVLENFNPKEFLDIIKRQSSLFFFSKFDFRKLAYEEIRKCSKHHLVKQAAQLVKGIKKENYTQFGPAGIRAQLVDIRNKKLEMDFILEGDKNSLHILNVVSPGLTSAFAFSEYIYEQIGHFSSKR